MGTVFSVTFPMVALLVNKIEFLGIILADEFLRPDSVIQDAVLPIDRLLWLVNSAGVSHGMFPFQLDAFLVEGVPPP